ncbi:LysR family transcriptional regulator [Salinicola halimionae]|uniref:LysR family transcriptional regulator n=1 Tax=Salinicola halimionae TaxID=1949081 RepID=UPI000DA111D3|nr:LysR family transcriptional regulator [Salinicola halimionae]
MDDFESLRIFVCVAEELSVTGAARRLGKSPSNVTTKLQKLEANLGAELLVRTGKRISLSHAGEAFLDYAAKLLSLRAESMHVVSGGRTPGTIRIGSMEATAASRLPDFLASFNTAFPAVRLELGTGPSMKLMDDVRSGRLDCAFLAIPPSFLDSALSDRLEVLDLVFQDAWEESLVLLSPRGIADQQDSTVRTLAAFPPGCTYRRIAEETLNIPESDDWTIQETSSYHVMVALASTGRCVTVLPESVLGTMKIPETLISTPLRRVKTQVTWRKGYGTPAFDQFLGHLSGTDFG